MVERPAFVLQPGARLGPYELVRWLGEGGFAEVWLASRPGAPSEPRVAIKVVRRSRAQDPAARAMFRDEANLASRIRHPNVARVRETGEDGPLLYQVMEHVAGGSLDAVMRGARALGEPVPVAVAVRLIADTCAGLHAAHELEVDGRPQHVVHRDISPQNILITESGVPKLIDFGVAKARERVARETTSGVAKGKLAYMSPEQARVEELDRRSDLWSIAAVAYELLEGRPLVDGETDVARLRVLANGTVTPAFTRVPARVAAVLTRALSADRESRQADADELRLDLERALAREGLEASSADIAAYCGRAREAARAAEAEIGRSPRYADLLGALPAGATAVLPVAGSDASPAGDPDGAPSLEQAASTPVDDLRAPGTAAVTTPGDGLGAPGTAAVVTPVDDLRNAGTTAVTTPVDNLHTAATGAVTTPADDLHTAATGAVTTPVDASLSEDLGPTTLAPNARAGGRKRRSALLVAAAIVAAAVGVLFLESRTPAPVDSPPRVASPVSPALPPAASSSSVLAPAPSTAPSPAAAPASASATPTHAKGPVAPASGARPPPKPSDDDQIE